MPGRVIVSGVIPLTPRMLGNVEDAVFALPNVDIFTPDLVVPALGTIVVEFLPSSIGTLSLKLVRNAATNIGALNLGVTLAISQWNSFSFPVQAGDEVNLRYSVGVTATAAIFWDGRIQ